MGALALLLVLLVSAALPGGAEAYLVGHGADSRSTEFDNMMTISDLVQALGDDPKILRLPVGGQAMVMAYNVPELGEAGPSIMIDGDVLAAIWSGNVTKWNDEAILQLNPALAASLPDRNITIGYVDGCRLTSSCNMLEDALQSLSPAFAAEFSARGRLHANMRFATEGRGRPLGESSRDRAAWLKAEPYGLAFLDHADALNAGHPVRSMAMFNRAGTLVEPSAGSVELAMRDANDAYAAGNLTSDFYDPPGYGSWPLTHVLFATVANSLEEVGSSISINGKDRQADPTPAVHWAFRTVSTLADRWTLPAEVVRSSLSMAVMPMAAYSLVPAANLPTLRGLRLVLDFPAIAAIYMGEITNWSDSRIRALNDDAVCAELPDAEIHVVVVDDVESEANELLTDLLSAKVPAFASAMGNNSHPTFPVMASNATLRSASPSGVIKHLTDTTHSFAVWYGYDLGHNPRASKHQRRISPVQAAGIKSDEGVVVFADNASISAALAERVESQSAPRRAEAAMLDVPGAKPWPMTVVSSVLYQQSTMKDCSQATGLADHLHWILTDPLAESQVQTEAMVPASSNAKLKRFGLNQLAHFTCEGVPVIAIAKLDHQSELDRETSEQAWTISTTLGTVMKIIFTILAIIVGIVIFTLRPPWLRQLFTRNRGRAMNMRRLTIDRSTIQLGDALDVGVHGCVWRATWQEREVVVKTMGGARPSARLVRTFNKEISAIASMRHPDLADLLGVCTDPSFPLSIVREYMPHRSLYDVLHNKRPLSARIRLQMAFEIARGMHFVHSSGLVHMNLTSRNVLVADDYKIQVSGFGLSKFKSLLRGERRSDRLLGQSPAEADVFSFGIILWELITRKHPSKLRAWLVRVISHHSGGLSEEDERLVLACLPLINSCCSCPAERPSFLDLMLNLGTRMGRL